MRKLLIALFLLTFSCNSTKSIQTKVEKKSIPEERPVLVGLNEKKVKNVPIAENDTSSPAFSLASNIVETAKSYEGTRYKYGGTTKRGMDCSGLVMTAYDSENIRLPRTTSELAESGDWVDLKEVEKGDLLFFATRRNSRTVNHVGIVTEARIGHVEFIHASTSSGVIISSLSEKFWYFAFVQARRVL